MNIIPRKLYFLAELARLCRSPATGRFTATPEQGWFTLSVQFGFRFASICKGHKTSILGGGCDCVAWIMSSE